MKVEIREGPKPPPELEALDYFVGIWSCVGRLEAHGVPVTVRDTRGREIDGACGQLAASAVARP